MASTPFPDDALVRIEIRTERDLAEVFLIDHDFSLVGRAVGSLAIDVPPGVYKVKAHLGAITFEELVVLNEDRVGATAIDLSRRLGVLTPAPILGTPLSHEYQAALAATESQSVDVEAGTGAEIFLMTRRWSEPDSQEPGDAGLTSLTLHSERGEMIADLLEVKSLAFRGQGDPAAGATVAVDPGPYLLRWSDRAGVTAEQSVFAVPDWQTQVFLVEEEFAGGQTHRHNVSLLLSRERFDPSDDRLAVVEEARSALAEERKVATEVINETLFGEFENPMLGLFGAHLMLIADVALRRQDDDWRRSVGEVAAPAAPVQFDQRLFDRAVARLREQLGGNHPDVMALATRASDQGAKRPLEAPPLLWNSWQLLVEASRSDPELAPAEIWRRTLGALPMRPFLIWAPADDQDAIAQRWEEQIASTLAEAGPALEAPTLPAGVFASLVDLPEDPRDRLSRELMVPRAVVDRLAPPDEPFDSPEPEPTV